MNLERKSLNRVLIHGLIVAQPLELVFLSSRLSLDGDPPRYAIAILADVSFGMLLLA
jgi:hypothetical protein